MWFAIANVTYGVKPVLRIARQNILLKRADPLGYQQQSVLFFVPGFLVPRRSVKAARFRAARVKLRDFRFHFQSSD